MKRSGGRRSCVEKGGRGTASLGASVLIESWSSFELRLRSFHASEQNNQQLNMNFMAKCSGINPFTATACKVSGLKDARKRLQTVYFPVPEHLHSVF